MRREPTEQGERRADDAKSAAANKLIFAFKATPDDGRIVVTLHDPNLAARFADQYELGLRAGDALHLAICVDHGATLCTLDRRLSGAGSALGVKTMLL